MTDSQNPHDPLISATVHFLSYSNKETWLLSLFSCVSPRFFSYSDESRGLFGFELTVNKALKLQKLEIISCLSGAVLNYQTHTLIQANCPLAKQLANLLTLTSAKWIEKIPHSSRIMWYSVLLTGKKVMFLFSNVSFSFSASILAAISHTAIVNKTWLLRF